jgi:hypothetical protein
MSSPPSGASTTWDPSQQPRRASDSKVVSSKGSTAAATDDAPAAGAGDESKPGPPPPSSSQAATSELEINIVSPGPGDEAKSTRGEFWALRLRAWQLAWTLAGHCGVVRWSTRGCRKAPRNVA